MTPIARLARASGSTSARSPISGGDDAVIGATRIHVAECESTQLLLLDASLPEGAVATTDHQTGGRGRLGRAWVEPPGTSVLCSVLLRPPTGRPFAQLSLVGGLAVAEAVEAVSGLPALIKWPNDVLVEGHKVAGVLAEQRGGAVVLGIGINVNQEEARLPADARVPAGSLRSLTGRVFERGAVLDALLERLDVLYARWSAGGFVAVRDGLQERDFLVGRMVTVGDVTGIAGGVDSNGRLLVGGHPVESGEVDFAAG